MYRCPSTPSFSSPPPPSAGSSATKSPDDGDRAEESSSLSVGGVRSGLLSSTSSSVSLVGADAGRMCSTGISQNLGRLAAHNSSSSSSAAATPSSGGARAAGTSSSISSVSCVTPVSSNPRNFRGVGLGSSSSSSRRARMARLAAAGAGGFRQNPFDSVLSSESLKLPVLSPSVFNTVESPSQESAGSGGRFWSVEQQAWLFPAAISDDSPWKQETASVLLDPEAENRTQEAINLYFSQHHQIESPELNNSGASMMAVDAAHSTAAPGALVPGTDGVVPGDDVFMVGNNSSGDGSSAAGANADPQPRRLVRSASCNVSRRGSFAAAMAAVAAPTPVSQWSQTELTLPPVLPEDVEAVLKSYFTFADRQDDQLPVASAPPGHQLACSTGGSNTPREADQQAGNLSTSTLRRKLFEGFVDDDGDAGSSSGDGGGYRNGDDEILAVPHSDDDEHDKEDRADCDGDDVDAPAAASENDNQIMSSPIQDVLPRHLQEQRSAVPSGGFSSPLGPSPAPAITPISKVSRLGGSQNPKWSSSPISKVSRVSGSAAAVGPRTSVTPPVNLASPSFSPVFPTADAAQNKKS